MTFFFRFDPIVIEQRKATILEFLYFCASNPVIYRSQCFVKFFEDGTCPPIDDKKCLKDDKKDSGESFGLSSSKLKSDVAGENYNTHGLKDTKTEESSFENFSFDQFDYLYDSAISFSEAVQQEANLRYKPAFELYKIGIDKLLTGAKTDNNERRKRIAKAKAAKYLERAEMLYEHQIAFIQDEQFLLENQEINNPSVFTLERPVNNLCRFKVIAINDYLMRVQDCTDKKFYFLKKACKYQNCKIFLPQTIPYMIDLCCYYKTEDSLYLLLPLISGGLLWDYINEAVNENISVNLEEIFVEPPFASSHELNYECTKIEPFVASTSKKNLHDLTIPISIPSHKTLSSESDINDLLSCSQKLLKSVSETLEKSHVKATDDFIEIKSKKEAAETTLSNSKIINPKLNDSRKLVEIPENIFKQWFCELIVAVNSLHKSGIVCGDLNLNNILLGPMGHLALTYFYQVDCEENQLLNRVNPNAMRCQYVAFDFPITQNSDWYSVGVIMYEIITGERFYSRHPPGASIEVQYSNPASISDDIKSLLHGLIIEKPEKRFKFDDLVAHPFFITTDWIEIEKCGLALFRNRF